MVSSGMLDHLRASPLTARSQHVLDDLEAHGQSRPVLHLKEALPWQHAPSVVRHLNRQMAPDNQPNKIVGWFRNNLEVSAGVS